MEKNVRWRQRDDVVRGKRYRVVVESLFTDLDEINLGSLTSFDTTLRTHIPEIDLKGLLLKAALPNNV